MGKGQKGTALTCFSFIYQFHRTFILCGLLIVKKVLIFFSDSIALKSLSIGNETRVGSALVSFKNWYLAIIDVLKLLIIINIQSTFTIFYNFIMIKTHTVARGMKKCLLSVRKRSKDCPIVFVPEISILKMFYAVVDQLQKKSTRLLQTLSRDDTWVATTSPRS